MRVRLYKPYSIWTTPLTQEAKTGKYICDFTFYGGIWKEGNGCVFGLSDEHISFLISSGAAIYI